MIILPLPDCSTFVGKKGVTMHLSRTVIQLKRTFLLLMIFLLLTVKAAPRRGLIETYSFQDSLDFSAINDSCQKRVASTGGSWSFNGCVMATPDVKMALNQTYAAYGILDLGKCPDTGCIGTLISVPTSGYLDSADFSYDKMGHLFAIRTSEMNYALLYMYAWGSGLPFKAFKWAYQPDGTPNFSGLTVIHSTARTIPKYLLKIKVYSMNNNASVSWTPMPGTIRLNVFDLKGRLMQQMECDALQGKADVWFGCKQEGQQVNVLQIIINNKELMTTIIKFK